MHRGPVRDSTGTATSVRTELWRAATAALGEPAADVPDFLGEENLARFGAYRSD